MVNWFKRFQRKPVLGNRLQVEIADKKAAYVAAREESLEPWATFEVDGFEPDGRIKVSFNFNKAFIKQINALGFQAETDEDSVQLFFYTSQGRPVELSGGDDGTVISESHPSLSAKDNVIRM